jgi:hypothetical protein
MRSGLFKLAAILSFAVVIPLLAADFWEKEKDFTKWREKDCTKLLKKSPWAFSNSFRNTANLGSTNTGERETGEIIEFRLLTAKPVRMAFGQLQLLTKPDDQALREQIMNYVNAPPGDEILVQISYRGLLGVSPYIQNLAGFFSRATLATFVNNTSLTSSENVHVPLSNYLPWNSERPNPIFVFPRFADDGTPHFTGKEKSISLRSEFETGALNSKEYKIYVNMKPKDMIFQGEFEL